MVIYAINDLIFLGPADVLTSFPIEMWLKKQF